MIGNRKCWTVAVFAMALTLACVRPASSANALSFPPTNFAILNPDTGTVIGRSRYRIDSAGDGATLRGENGYFDGQTDVEVARLKLSAEGTLPKLVEFDHTFYNADKSILKRSHLDLRSGAATCIDNAGAQRTDQSAVLDLPDDTWAGASIVIPIQDLLRAGVKGASRPLHVFNCAPSPKIFAISVKVHDGSPLPTSMDAQAVPVLVRAEVRRLEGQGANAAMLQHEW